MREIALIKKVEYLLPCRYVSDEFCIHVWGGRNQHVDNEFFVLSKVSKCYNYLVS